MNGFKSPFVYRSFANAIKMGPRFIHTQEVTAFLEAVVRGSEDRKIEVPPETLFWRAQMGNDRRSRSKEAGRQWEEEIPHGPERMVPQPRLVKEGRINPRGIAYLYLAVDKETAVSEVRPFVGALVTVAWFRTTRALTLVGLSRETTSDGPPVRGMLWWASRTAEGGPPPQEEIDRTVWANIDSAFSQPVDPTDEHLSYVPTQVIAESLMAAGFDGVIYRSGLNPDGYNLALFDVDSAEFLGSQLVRVNQVEFESKDYGNPWFLEHGRFFTAEITDVRPVEKTRETDETTDGEDEDSSHTQT